MPASILDTLLAFAWAALVAVLILRALCQSRAYELLDAAPRLGERTWPEVTAIVPARNEAAAIGTCIAGIVAQDYPADRLHLVIVDDGSTDGTAAIARAAAPAARSTLLDAGALPAGWTGKSHACWCGAGAAQGAWLCFLDADTEPQAALLSSAIAAAERDGIDLLSLEPQQRLVTMSERLVIPAGLFALAFVCDLRRGDAQHVPVNGQFLLARRRAYAAVDGHRAVRAAITEDSRLAGVFQAAGFSVALKGAPALIRARMYRNLPDLWEGLSKNSTETLGGPARALAVGLLAPLLAWTSYALPIILGCRAVAAPSPASIFAATLALAASLAIISLHIAGTRYFRIPFGYGLVFPAGYTLAALIALDGLRKWRRGRVGWKGRSYATGALPRPDLGSR